MNTKLFNLPSIHYISLEESIERRKNLHEYFSEYNITNIIPHFFKRFEETNFKIIGDKVDELTPSFKGALSSHFTVLKEWYQNTTESRVLIVEDDLSLESVEYWNFTWRQFENNLPNDWNCIQLVLIREYDCQDYKFEKRNTFDWCAGAYLINRQYVKYLLDTYYYSNFLDLSNCNHTPVLEHIIFSDKPGIYCLPLFLEDCLKTESTMIHPYKGEVINDNQRNNHHTSYHSVLNWWKQKGKNLSINEIMNISTKVNHIYQEPQFGENWFSYPNLYKSMVERFPSGSKFVEIGSWKGKSSAFLAVEIANSNKDIEFTCIDTWEGSVEHEGMKDLQYLYNIFTDNMKPLEKYYRPLRMPSLEAANQFEDYSLDFVFIDASHEYEDVKKDIAAWIKKVKPGGVIAGHDYYIKDYDYFPGVKQAVNESLTNFEASEDCWIYSIPIKSDDVLVNFSYDPENAQSNFELGLWYERQNHLGPALTFFLRASERTSDKKLSYESLIHGFMSYNNQGNRNVSAESMLHQALIVDPKRPEAYYLLSKYFENKQDWLRSYMFANLGLQLSNFDCPALQTDVGYPGIYALKFQLVTAGWWWGKTTECRETLEDLVINHWNEMPDDYKNTVENNYMRLGATEFSQTWVRYGIWDHDKLRFKFKDSEKIDGNYSQVYQDMFVLSMTNGKRNGTYLEVGGSEPFHNNNTALLEKFYNWKGVSIELNEDAVVKYRKNRPFVNVIHEDATKIDYNKLLEQNYDSNIIDYLQLDIEPARNTFECLLTIPFNKYKFRVITYEHDYYIDVSKSYREKSRRYLEMLGYILVVNDISTDGISTFEDWWVHPDLVDPTIIDIMIDNSESIKKVDNYFLNK